MDFNIFADDINIFMNDKYLDSLINRINIVKTLISYFIRFYRLATT